MVAAHCRDMHRRQLYSFGMATLGSSLNHFRSLLCYNRCRLFVPSLWPSRGHQGQFQIPQCHCSQRSTSCKCGVSSHHHSNSCLQGRIDRVIDFYPPKLFLETNLQQSVIIPTVTSLKAAVKHYESVGGTASIFVNEDGMQTVSEELAQ